jgi:rSAM/selenodomain-associated transferase 1
MVKEPLPGRVKTRLGRDIGTTSAAWWFRHQVSALLRRIRDPRWDVVLAVSPDRDGLLSRVWPPDMPRIAQGQGDLGARMGRILGSDRTGPMLIIGADIPGIQRRHLAAAFQNLGSTDAVIGPAPDGGFWLIGWCAARIPPFRLFDGVRWSSPHALDDTLHSLRGCRIAFVATLADVDTSADFMLQLK